MNGVRMAGLVLIVAGVLALAYGGFSYTRETEQASIGPLHLSVEARKTINFPLWAGIGTLVIGGALVLVGARKN